jgi:acyl-CoA thioesterase-1
MRWPLLILLVAALRAETVAFLGDSITAGYGLAPEEAYPALVGQALAADPATAGWKTVNAGVSGDTSAGGLRRIAWVLRGKPDLVVVALGGNDGLRGLPVDDLRKNLRGIIAACRKAGVRVALIGMRMPANLGPVYRGAFARVYPELAAAEDVPLLPFLLDGVAMQADLNLADGIHPNPAGQAVIAGKVAAWLKPLLAAPKP